MLGMDRQKQKILVVDDAPTNIHILGAAIKDNYQVIIATNGSDAIKIAQSEQPPDLILLDIVMPGMDGFEVCRQLKNHGQTKHIPIIFITAKNLEKDEAKGFELGAVDYIAKPYSPAIVRARVNTHLELKRHRDLLEGLSNLDGLTSIPNRRRFDDCLGVEWRNAAREGNHFSLLLMDVDFFKNFNDTFGHIAGDDCLIAVANTLSAATKRPSDLVARFGGEEFAAILPNTCLHGAEHVAERMRQRVESLQLSKYALGAKLTISIGLVSMQPNLHITCDVLLQAADKALYAAKDGGRNRVSTFQGNVADIVTKEFKK